MSSELRVLALVEVKGDADLEKLNRQLDDTAKSTENAGKQGAITTGVFQGVGQKIAGFGIGLAQAGIDTVINKVGESLELASDKAEAASKVNVLFGSSADVVAKASETAATSVALSSGEYLAAAGDLGNLTLNLGYSEAAAADMSVEMIALAADMGSFHNADTTEVTEAMGAAFRGETEPIRRFGVMLSDATVKAEAVKLGLYSGVGAIDANAKAQATYSLILDQTSAAQGDLARTSDGLANSQKINAARMEDAWTRVGEALTPLAQTILPIVADVAVMVAEGIGTLLEAIGEWVDDNRALIDSVVELGRFLWDLYMQYIATLIDVIGELGYRVGGLIGLFVDLGGAMVDVGGGIASILRGDFEQAAIHGELLASRIGSFAENVQRAIGDTGRRAADETATQIARITTDVGTGAVYSMSAIAGAYHDGKPYVAAAAQEVGEALPEAVEEGATQAAAVAAQTPGEIAAGLRSGRDAVGSAMSQLKDDMKNAIAPAKEIAELEGALSGKRLTKGLASTDPIVRSQAEQTVSVIEARLDELRGVGETAGQEGAGAIPGGMADEDRAVSSAAASTTKIVATQFNLMESGARIAGQTANMTLAQALDTSSGSVRSAAGHVADAWGTSTVSTIRGYRDNIAAAAAYAYAPLRGYSPPKVGPLRHIDEWGANVAAAWTEPALAGLRHFRHELEAVGAPGDMSSVSGPGAGGAGSVYYVTVNAGVGDPVAIGRETVAAIQAYERSSGRDWRSN